MSISEAIQAVRQLSKDLVVLPEHELYDEITKSYFSELVREQKPASFLTPSSTQEVAGVVKAIKPFAGVIKVAICGSGQQTVPGGANAHNGITIHLGKLRGIEVDGDNKIVSVAAGEKMGSVYEKVATLGLGVVGNRHSSGGVGGDAVQGGLSYFSYARGFVCDNVANYEIVLSSGEIVNANSETNSDLWLALRGGCNNFGIVTRFDLRVFEQGQMWGGKLFYFPPSFSSQIQSLVRYLHDDDADIDVHICLSLGYAAAMGSIVCMNDIFCTRPEKPKALESFAEIQPQIEQMNTLRVGSIKDFTGESFGGATANRVIKVSTTVKADAGILEYAVQAYLAAFENLKDVTNLLFSITFEPIRVSLIEKSVARGGNSLGLKAVDGPLVVIMFYTSWDDSSEDELALDVTNHALKNIETKAREDDLGSPYRYMSYTLDHKDAIISYGTESIKNLLAASAKYDPAGIFRHSLPAQ